MTYTEKYSFLRTDNPAKVFFIVIDALNQDDIAEALVSDDLAWDFIGPMMAKVNKLTGLETKLPLVQDKSLLDHQLVITFYKDTK